MFKRIGVRSRVAVAGGAAVVVAAGAALVAGAVPAQAAPPDQYLTATGTVAPPDFQTFAATSTGSSPAHVALSVTQTGAYKFSISSTFSDDTAGATVASNNAATTNNSSYEGQIAWNVQDGNLYTGSIKYQTPGTYLVTDTVTDSNGATATAQVTVSTAGSAYAPVTPSRILDTRKGIGAAASKVGAGSIVKLKVAGTGSIPSSGVTAVDLNVTVVAGTGAGFITVYPSDDGTSVPNVSSLNYKAGQTVANSVTVPVGKDGYVYLANSSGPAGPVDLIADVSGYYSRSATQLYEPMYSPTRLLDTRKGIGAAQSPVANDGTVPLLVALGNNFLAAPGDMSAVAVNITVVSPTGNGYIAAYADGSSRPTTSTLNYTNGQTVANTAIVPVAADGKIDLTNEMSAAGSTQILVDVVGYFSTDALSAYVPLSPSRVFDSRKDGLGQIQNGIEYDLPLGDWAVDTDTIQMNVTVAGTKSSGFLTLYAETGALPSTSSLNWTAGQTVANGAFVGPNGNNGWIAFYNGGTGATDVILDISGYFQSSFV